MMILTPEECPPFFQYYAEYVQGDDLNKELEAQLVEYVNFIRSLPKEKHLYRYADKKWTIKEIVGHCTDTERIKAAVALRIARSDKAAIPGFDEDEYVLATDFNSRTMEDLLEEFITVRKASLTLYKSLSEEELKIIGMASNKQISSRALFYFLVGHINRHIEVIKERYL